VINQKWPSGRHVTSRVLLGLAITLAPMSFIVGASPSAEAAVASYSDGIADTAREALRVFKGQLEAPASVVTASAAKASPVANSIVAGNGVTTSIVVVTTVPPLQTGAVAAVAAPAPFVPGVQAAAGPAGASWSSVVIATEDISAYVTGTIVVDDQDPRIAAVLAALPVEPASRYEATLVQLAAMVAERTKVSADALVKVWRSTDDRRMKAILTAMAQVGTRYRYTGNQPGGFDCSGLTSYAWAQAGVKIPRTSTEQISKLSPRSIEQMLPGDLIWRPGHIGLYLGVGDAMVHSPQTGKTVEVKKIGRSSRWASPLP
jgi:peptidoglycan DL-endopeptidase CwlO